jgi:transcriptional regulator with XRE-family HTH domain
MEAIRVWRDALGLTTEDAQRRCPPTRSGKMVQQNQWSRAEKGGVIPKPEALNRYCKALGLSLFHLWGVQAIIEEYRFLDPNYNHINQHETIISIFTHRTKIPKKIIIPIPGPYLFGPEKDGYPRLDNAAT